jgi:hypothetical protein
VKITPLPFRYFEVKRKACGQGRGIVTTMDTYETRDRNRYSDPVMSFGNGTTVATGVPERPVSDAVPSDEV